jgi:hypothetical protein
VVTPPTPLRPVASVSAAPQEVNAKTGTSIVKTAPPKETARITVKPNLPASPARVGNFQGGKPVAVGVPVAAAAVVGAVAPAKGSVKPATTIVKTGTTKVAPVSVKTVAAAGDAGAVPVPAMQFQEETSTTLTTVLAGVLAVLTWGTAAVLAASYLGMIGS